jgi:hypothetical protein
VNWVESIGDIGSWFFICVVSRVRNMSKFSASRVRPAETESEVVVAVVEVADVTVMA